MDVRSKSYAECMAGYRMLQGGAVLGLGAMVLEVHPPTGLALIAVGADSMRAGVQSAKNGENHEPLLTQMAKKLGIEAWNHETCEHRAGTWNRVGAGIGDW